MSRRLALVSLLAATVCVACGGGGSKRLQGTWKGVRAEGVGDAAKTAANAFAAGMKVEVKGDAITVTTPKDKQSGHYKVVTDDKTRVVITTDKDGPTEPQTFTFADEKTMSWAVAAGQTIVFARQ